MEHRPNVHVVGDDRVVPSGHVGSHDSPCAKTAGQFPTNPLLGISVLHDSGTHVASLDFPKEHVVKLDVRYPGSHWNWHDLPCGSSVGQSPIEPCAGEDRVQALGAHWPIWFWPNTHCVAQVSSYPTSQVGVHDSPSFSGVVHSPTDPYNGGSGTGHDLGTHLAGYTLPKAHDVDDVDPSKS